MDKAAKAAYLCNLLMIMESRDAAGAIGRGRSLADEYERVYADFMDDIKKEQQS